VHITEPWKKLFVSVRYPDILVVDNGPELRARALDTWAMKPAFSCISSIRSAGKQSPRLFTDPPHPTQNAYIESFNGRFRDDCLNRHWFTSIGDAREII